MAPTLKVGKNFCECTGCGEFFWSVSSFDKHQIKGRNGTTRCLKPEEMHTINLEKNKQGYWITKKGFGEG